MSAAPTAPSRLRWIAWIPHVAVTVLMIVAMVDMLAGVFLRYVMTKVSVWLDLPMINFFWVEEIGEYSLIWLTFIGAAIGIHRGAHFSVQLVTDRMPARARRALFIVEYAVIAAFGVVVAVFGWKVADLNSQSFSPALNLNLWWLYVSSVVGGVLIAVYSVGTLVDVARGRDLHPPLADAE